jgi:ABC-2 type transport system ATP-binding protein
MTPDTQNGPALEIRDLVKTFGDFVAVDHVSFQVTKGEIFGFLGPNGAGKSTVIRMLCGLLTPTSGWGAVAGFDVTKNPEEIRKNIGYMSQKFSLYDDLAVEENIDFFSRIYSVPKHLRAERKEYVLRMAGLVDRRTTVTKLLAGGWKQRLALGCAIVHSPRILFLDEPTSGVDPIARRSFWDLIYQLAEGGQTILVTTHYMDEAEYCHRLALIYRGKLIALGVPDALKRDLHSHKLLQLETSDLLGTMRALEGAAGRAGRGCLRRRPARERGRSGRRHGTDPPLARTAAHSDQAAGADPADHGRRFCGLIEAEEQKIHELPPHPRHVREGIPPYPARLPQPHHGAVPAVVSDAAVRLRAESGRGPHSHADLRRRPQRRQPRPHRALPRLPLF